MASFFDIAQLVVATNLHSKRLLPGRIKPLLANIKLTENCNAKCITCDYWKTRWENGITTQRAIKLLGEMHELGIRNVRFTGGEPLVRRDFRQILETCERSWFDKVVLATNGLLIEKQLEWINESIITHVTVSVDGFEGVNDVIRGVPGYFKKAVSGLSKVTKSKKIVTTLTKKVIPELGALIDFCKDHGFDFDFNLLENELYFFSSENVGSEIKDLMPSGEDMERAFEILEAKGIATSLVIKNARSYYVDRNFNFQHCVLGFLEVHIDSGGGVRTGCNVFDPVDNINTRPLAEILGLPEYRADVLKMFDFECSKCSCGYGMSVAVNHPISSIGYALKRMR